MTSGTVVVLPSTDPGGTALHDATLHPEVAATAVFVRVPADPASTLSARTNAALSARSLAEPLTLVAFGAAALLLPSIALAQRAAHRRVSEYLLVEPAIPGVSDGWPDAHVTVFSDSDSRQARLRGWDVRPTDELAHWVPARE